MNGCVKAALLGPVAAAAHNLMFNLGVATTQVCESVAVATQTLLAREMGGLPAASLRAPPSNSNPNPNPKKQEPNSKSEADDAYAEEGSATASEEEEEEEEEERRVAVARARSWHIIRVGCGAGGLVASVLSLGTLCFQKSVVAGLTNSEPIRAACLSIMPLVLFTQVRNQ